MLQQVRTLRPALAEAWLDAAPQSTLDNLYGPTEATVVCLRQEVARPKASNASR
jgi:non-ribosomal peptide synthetase component F